jgi:hypothetical protein
MTEQRFKWRWVILALLVLIYFVYRPNADDDSTQRRDFVAACTITVEDKLKAPSTADLSPISFERLQKAGNSFRWVGTVDAENSFGARIRSNFVCEGPPDNPRVTLY